MAELSVLLLTKNGRGDLERLLPALYGQRSIPPFEVIAIDSGSSDGTIELLRRFPVRLVQISPETFHHAHTRNLAAEMAQGEILIFLSQDAIPASDLWLKTMISNFDDPMVGAVYGRQLPKPGCYSERKDTFDVVYGTKRIVKDPSHRNGLGYRFYHFSSVNSGIRKSVWQANRFPQELKVFEDLGIAKRILDRGWKIVYEPEAPVFHSHNHTPIELFKRYFDIGYTLKRLNIWNTPGTTKSIWRDAWKLLRKKISNRSNQGPKQNSAGGICSDIAKGFGLFLGVNQNCLPVVLKRHLSAFRLFE